MPTQTKLWYSFIFLSSIFSLRRLYQIPLFTNEPNGAAAKSKYVMGRRNWCSVRWDNATGDLEFDLRVEKVKGLGTTVGWVHLHDAHTSKS